MPARHIADANTAAQRLHARLATDYDRPVDIFRTVQDEGIWLASKPLSGGLYGFYLRNGEAAGIVVNAGHPEPLQRYTCAHELGHHVLGHRSRLDERDDVQGPTAGHRTDEVAAQAFAGAFLMPLQAVNRVMRRLGIPRNRRLRPADVYAISRELDVSFSAAAWQLASLSRLTPREADQWAKEGASAAKTSMRPGPPPEGDNRAAVYIVDATGADVPILCRPGDELRLRLAENASTGHVWRMISPPDTEPTSAIVNWDGDDGATRDVAVGVERQEEAVTASVADQPALRLAQRNYLPGGGPHEPDATGTVVIGQSGTREFVILADRPGRAVVDARLARPFESGEVGRFSTHVRVGPAHVLDGFAREQAQAHAARVAEG